jgi:hypothetical protein
VATRVAWATASLGAALAGLDASGSCGWCMARAARSSSRGAEAGDQLPAVGGELERPFTPEGFAALGESVDLEPDEEPRAQGQHLREEPRHRLPELLPEPRDRRMIRQVLRADHPERHIRGAQLPHPPRRRDPVRIRLHQHHQQQVRGIPRRPRTAGPGPCRSRSATTLLPACGRFPMVALWAGQGRPRRSVDRTLRRHPHRRPAPARRWSSGRAGFRDRLVSSRWSRVQHAGAVLKWDVAAVLSHRPHA